MAQGFRPIARRFSPFAAGLLIGLLAPLTVVVLAASPLATFRISSLFDGQEVSGVVALTVFSDTAGVTSVQFRVDGRSIGSAITDGPCLMAWDTRTTQDGPHVVDAFVRDVRGTASWTPSVSVVVSNASATPGEPERRRRAAPR